MIAAFRWLNWLAFLLFLFAVAVQVNDPDAPVWMAIYGAAAAVCAWAALRPDRFPWLAPAVVGGIGLVCALRLWPQVAGRVRISDLFASWEMKNATVEVARECGGLLIIAAWMALLLGATLVRPAAAKQLARPEATITKT